MKPLLMLIALLFACSGCLSVGRGNPPEATPKDDLYRKDGKSWLVFTKLTKVVLPAPKTIEQAEHAAKLAEIKAESEARITRALAEAENTKALYKGGRSWLGWGLFLLTIGAALTFYLRAYQLAFIGAITAIVGIGAIGRGAGMMQVAEKPWIIGLCCVGVVIFSGASLLLKDRGVEIKKLFTGKYFKKG